MSKVFWDTNIFIYLIEEYPQFAQDVDELRRKMISRKDQLVTSSLTLGEVQVKPRKMGFPDEAIRYRDSIIKVAEIIPFDNRAADAYALARESTSVRGPDAVQLACASSFGVELFVTNDINLHKQRITGVHFIVSVETALKLLA